MDAIIDYDKQKKLDASGIHQQMSKIPSRYENNQSSQIVQAEVIQNRVTLQNRSFHGGTVATTNSEVQQTMVNQFQHPMKQNNNIYVPTADPVNDQRFGNFQPQKNNSQGVGMQKVNSNLANINKEDERKKQFINDQLTKTQTFSESKVQKKTQPAQQGFQGMNVNKFTQSSETNNSQIPSNQKFQQTQEISQNFQNTESPDNSFTRNQAQSQQQQLISQNFIQNTTNLGIYSEKQQVFQNSKMELENQQSQQLNIASNQIRIEQTAQGQKNYIEPINTNQETSEKILENKPLPTEGDKMEIQKENLNIQTKLKYQNSLQVINKLLEICRKNNIIDPELEEIEKFTNLKFKCCDSSEQKIFQCSQKKCIFHLNCLRNRLDSLDLQEYKCSCGLELPTRVLQEVDTIQTRFWLEKRLELESQDLKFKLNREILKCQAPFCTFWCYQSETYQPHQNYYCISCQVSVNLERPQIIIQQQR